MCAGVEQSAIPGTCPLIACDFDDSSFCSYFNGPRCAPAWLRGKGRLAHEHLAHSSTGLSLPASAEGPREWRMSDRQVANSLTGIYADASQGQPLPSPFTLHNERTPTRAAGMFAYAGLTDRRADVFLLSSPVLTTAAPARLAFNYYQAGVEGRLRLCLDDVERGCLFESLGVELTVEARNWRRVSIPIPPGTTVVCPPTPRPSLE